MKKIYLVKNDPERPCGQDNWRIMDRPDFLVFLHSEEGKERAKDFGKLNGFGDGDYMIIAECGKDEAAIWRSEKDRADYLYFYERMASVSDLDDIEIEAPDESVADTVLVRIMKDDLRVATMSLSEEDRELIEMMFLSEDPMTEEQYAAYSGLTRSNVHYRKGRILARLRDLIGS